LRGDIEDAVGDFCNVWPIIGYSHVGVSYWNLTLISINRNLAMSNPKLATKIFTWKRCAVYHVTLWFIFLAYFMIPLFGIWGEMMYQPKTFRCSINTFDDKVRIHQMFSPLCFTIFTLLSNWKRKQTSYWSKTGIFFSVCQLKQKSH
jgi:hypothetical protein